MVPFCLARLSVAPVSQQILSRQVGLRFRNLPLQRSLVVIASRQSAILLQRKSDGSWCLRGYTDLGHKYDRTGGKPDTLFGVIFKTFVCVSILGCMINYRWLQDKVPWLRNVGFIRNLAGEKNEEAFVQGLAYDFGVDNVPSSIVSKYDLGIMKRVDALERPSKADAKAVQAQNSESDEPPPSESEFKKGGFRDRKIIEYENRVRAYSTPDKVFRLFATLKIHDDDGEGYGIYMTPDDFVRAITPGMRQPEGLGLDHFKTFDPKKDKLETLSVPADSIFRKLGENGLINFSDYLFLMTVLAISARHIEIAFKIFDVNGDGSVDAEEFEGILDVLRQQTSIGMRHREAKMLGSSYLARMKDEVLQMEFMRLQPEDGKITEKKFCKMLLTYAGISEQKQKKMLKRVKERFQGEAAKGVSFAELQGFSQVFRHLNDIDTALGLYHVAGGSIDQSTLKRVVKTVAKADLDDHIVDVVFTLFDDNEDGRLSQREFISIMKARQMRGLERPKDMGVTRLLAAVWKCAKEEIQGSRGG
ncbi:Calcium uptake protein 1, mitochondrial [Hypsibius exemplaris]|uniref:Calcium uptake protein 1, mitochondrial n=1 Tax=Hypsibius exemplaris TaxID=2072580 RepID=A0A1W0WET9_HYPEX|nr:Calcium uptake protein 1, mitochondrial [Hypsibius exemplaris]